MISVKEVVLGNVYTSYTDRTFIISKFFDDSKFGPSIIKDPFTKAGYLLSKDDEFVIMGMNTLEKEYDYYVFLNIFLVGYDEPVMGWIDAYHFHFDTIYRPVDDAKFSKYKHLLPFKQVNP